MEWLLKLAHVAEIVLGCLVLSLLLLYLLCGIAAAFWGATKYRHAKRRHSEERKNSF